LSDPLGRIGINMPKMTDDRNHSVFGRIASSVDVQPWLELTAIVSARYFFRDPFDELAIRQDPSSNRLTVSGTVETNFHGEAGDVLFELRPSVLLTWTRASFALIDDFGREIQNQSDDVLPTFRVGTAVAPLPWLALRGSVSSGFRIPDVIELFGNGGTFRANPDLVSERSIAYDAAVVTSGSAGILSGYASVGFFLTNIEDQIRFRRTSQFTLIAENIDEGRNLGVESEVRGAITDHFELIGEVTWTRTRDDATGNQIPGQPALVASVRPEAHTRKLSPQVSDLLLFVEVTHIGSSFADPTNLVVIQARNTMSVGIGALFFDSRLGLGFRVEDMFDVRGQDFLGFPLPGRSFSGRLSFNQRW
jgi:outer membrane receptor protein involved in Fe transport